MMTEVIRIIIAVGSLITLVILAVAFCRNHRCWSAQDINVWWVLMGWSIYAGYGSLENIAQENPPGFRTYLALLMVLLTGWVALQLRKKETT